MYRVADAPLGPSLSQSLSHFLLRAQAYDESFNQPSFALEPRPKRQKRVFGVWQGRRPTEDGVGASDPNGYLDLATASTTVFEGSGGGEWTGGSDSGRSADWGIRGIL